MADVDLAPVRVTVSSLSGTGGSGLVVPAGRPIMLQVVKPLTMIAVRAVRVFLQTLLGLLSAGTVAPQLLPASDFGSLLTTCASLSVASAVICVIQNSIELLTKFDQSNPTLSV